MEIFVRDLEFDHLADFVADENYPWEFRANVLRRLANQSCGPEEFTLLGLACWLEEKTEREARIAGIRAAREQAKLREAAA